MPLLSVIMIVKNEVAHLDDCLGSVRKIADEIVLCDTGSTDDTIAVAKRFGARVLEIPWHDDFAAARNESIHAAKGDWLLHMDADEMLDPEGAQRIRALVDADGAGADAVELILANYCNDPRAWRWIPAGPGNPYARGYAGYIRVGLLRLFRNGRGFEYREPVHENITESVLERGGCIRQEDILIHHYGYDITESRRGKKAQRYLAIARRKAQERPGDVKALHDFAEQALACGMTDEAETHCRRALVIAPDDIASNTTLANILLNRGDLDAARELLERLLCGAEAPPHAHTALAAIACREGRLDAAETHLDAALRADPRHVMARLYRARVLDIMGEARTACRMLEALHAELPGLREAGNRLQAIRQRRAAEAQFIDGDTEAALAALVAALHLDPEDPLVHNDLGVVLQSLGEYEKALESLDRALALVRNLPDAAANRAALIPLIEGKQ